MRPDQQRGEKPAGVLGVLASIWSVGLVGENVNEFEQACAAVAELIAADRELDALLSMPAQPDPVPDFNGRLKAAWARRAAALARVGGCEMTTGNKAKMEVLRALVASLCDDSEQTFAELCAEAGVDPAECAELNPELQP